MNAPRPPDPQLVVRAGIRVFDKAGVQDSGFCYLPLIAMRFTFDRAGATFGGPGPQRNSYARAAGPMLNV
jgi:hypothetical protein